MIPLADVLHARPGEVQFRGRAARWRALRARSPASRPALCWLPDDRPAAAVEGALRLARDSIPLAFRDLDAQKVRQAPAWLGKPSSSAQASTTRLRVVLVGASGVGKTTLACWMLRQLVDAGVDGPRETFDRARRALFVDAPGLCRAVREHRLGAGDAPLLDRARCTPACSC